MTKDRRVSDRAASELLVWYDERRRDLPWRRTEDPYRIWISEVMLQQTRVETVIPYFEAFLERFPDVETLASAPIEAVLAAWSGLGYYRRARQLHRAAQQVAISGEFPRNSKDLQALPGIGPYTAAAVASIAFGEVVPVLDGNVERLLCRHLALRADPKKVVVRRRLLDHAERLLDEERPGDSNQALMELGATVCRPVNPKCGDCPLAVDCGARELGTPERFPLARKRRRVEKIRRAVAVVRDRDRLLLFRRSETSDLMPGIWELPQVPEGSSRRKSEKALAERYGGIWELQELAGTAHHSITYRAIDLHVFSARFVGGETVAEGPEAAWVSRDELDSYPVSSMLYKVLEVFETTSC